jgi:hypothetical protein
VITLMMAAVGSSETSVNIYQNTWRNIPEVSLIHTRLRENLESHIQAKLFFTLTKIFTTFPEVDTRQHANKNVETCIYKHAINRSKHLTL